jgi:hypothetical protein
MRRLRHSPHGSVLPGTLAIPKFLFRITVAAEQEVFAVVAARCQYDDRLRLREARQVIEVTVLPKPVLDIAAPGSNGSSR